MKRMETPPLRTLTLNKDFVISLKVILVQCHITSPIYIKIQGIDLFIFIELHSNLEITEGRLFYYK